MINYHIQNFHEILINANLISLFLLLFKISVESMSMYGMGLGDWKPNPKMAESKEGMDLTLPMG